MSVNNKISSDTRGEFESRVALGVSMAKVASQREASRALVDNLTAVCTGGGIVAWAMLYDEGTPLAWLGLPLMVVIAVGKAVHTYRSTLDQHRFGHCWDRVALAHVLTLALELSPAVAHRLFPTRVIEGARGLTEEVAETLRNHADELEPIVSKIKAEVAALNEDEPQTKSTSGGDGETA